MQSPGWKILYIYVYTGKIISAPKYFLVHDHGQQLALSLCGLRALVLNASLLAL